MTVTANVWPALSRAQRYHSKIFRHPLDSAGYSWFRLIPADSGYSNATIIKQGSCMTPHHASRPGCRRFGKQMAALRLISCRDAARPDDDGSEVQ